jgi:hypothetical protein
MPDPILMGKAFALAGTVGLVLALLVGRWSRPGVAAAGAAVAVLVAVCAGAWVLDLLPRVPPTADLDRLLLIVLPAAVAAEVLAAIAGRAGWVARCAVAAAAAPVLLHGTVYVSDLSGPGSREWSLAITWLVFAGLAVVLIAAWAALNRLAVRTGGDMALVCIEGAVLGAGVVVMLSGYATGGQAGVPLAAGLSGVGAGLMLRKGKLGPEAAVGVGVVGLFGLLVVGRLFAGLTTLNAALLFAAPLLACLPEVLPGRPGLRATLRPVLAAVPVVVALLLAQQKFAADTARPASATEGSLDDYMNFGK